MESTTHHQSADTRPNVFCGCIFAVIIRFWDSYVNSYCMIAKTGWFSPFEELD